MVGEDKTNKGSIDLTSPYYLHPSDGPQIKICPIALRGDNYNEWTRSMRNNFRAKNKLGFLDGTIPKPAEGTLEAAFWVPVNSTLVGWVYCTLDSTIRTSVNHTDDVKDTWDDLPYYGELKKLWDEIEGYSKVPTCTCGAATAFHKEKEDEKIHTFLIGLNTTLYGGMVSNILMMEPLPSLNTVFAKAVTEERHHTVSHTHDGKADIVGFAAQGSARKLVSGRGSEYPKSSSSVCSHCGKPGHEQDTCFQLLGFPDWWYSENRINNTPGSNRGGRGGRGGERGAGRGRGFVANAAATQSAPNGPTVTSSVHETDRSGLPGLSDEQWATLVNLLNSSKGVTSSTERLSGPHFEDSDWSG